MRIGIFFGGPSREREISFAGGKTAYEHLDKSLFTAVPIFVDSFGRFVKVQPEVLYKPTIRDFFPGPGQQMEGYSLYVESFPSLATEKVPAEIGELLLPHQFGQHMDFAFLAMHGPDCEDGAIQGLLEWYRIPYSGPGLTGSSVSIDKILQNEMISLVNGQQKKTCVVGHEEWTTKNRQEIFTQVKQELGIPIVVKAPHQGSSIGVAIVQQDDFVLFEKAMNQCFFQLEITATEWRAFTTEEKANWGQRMANLDEGIGFPVVVEGQLMYDPVALLDFLDKAFAEGEGTRVLSSINAEDQVLLETFLRGQEFSCGCIQLANGQPFALPPTEVIKVVEVFDFNSKYKPGATRKRIPVETTFESNQAIRDVIALVFGRLGMNVCARIDGFLTPDGDVLLHDPNTIPGMSPTSLIFKQMAEIGLNVTQSITYFIRQSIRERIRTGKDTSGLRTLLSELDQKIQARVQQTKPRRGILIKANDGEYSKAQKIMGKLGAEGVYEAVPVLEAGPNEYYILPLPLMFKEYVEDVLMECRRERNAVLALTSREGMSLTEWYGGSLDLRPKMVENIDRMEAIDSWESVE